MLKDAEKFKMEDTRVKQKLEAKSEFEAYVFAVKAALEDCGSKLPAQDKVSCRKTNNRPSLPPASVSVHQLSWFTARPRRVGCADLSCGSSSVT